MNAIRRTVAMATVVAVTLVGVVGTVLAADRPSAEQALHAWYKLVLELVRHTPTYSPPVASRSFAYLGVSAYEAIAGGSDKLQSLAGQLNELTPVAAREPGAVYDDAVVLNATMTFAAHNFLPTRVRPASARSPRWRRRCRRTCAAASLTT